jgi:hypothetical protein
MDDSSSSSGSAARVLGHDTNGMQKSDQKIYEEVGANYRFFLH